MKALYTCLVFLAGAGCINTEKLYQESRDKAETRYLAELKSLQTNQNPVLYSAGWSKAKYDLLISNPEILKAEYAIADKIEDRVELWKQFIPSLSVSLSDTSTLGEIADLFTDTNLRVSSFFSFSNLLGMPSSLATIKLSKMGLEWQAELTMRNQVITLYRMFKEKQLMQLQREALGIERNMTREVLIAEDGKSDELEKKLREASEKIELSEEEWLTRFQDLYMSPYTKVNLTFGELPNIIYNPSDLDFTDTSRWGLLELNLLALSEMAEDQGIYSAYHRYIPNPYIGLSAPALYNDSTGFAFEPSEFRITPSLSWSLDTRGSISSQIKRLKRNKPTEKWAKDKRVVAEIKKLLDGKKALINVNKELADIRSLMQDYESALKERLIDEPYLALEKWKEFKEIEIGLLAKKIDICTSFWLIDERRWRQTTKQWRKAQVQRELREKKRGRKKDTGPNFLDALKKYTL